MPAKVISDSTVYRLFILLMYIADNTIRAYHVLYNIHLYLMLMSVPRIVFNDYRLPQGEGLGVIAGF